MSGYDWRKGGTERHHASLMQLLALIFVYAGLADDTRDASAATDRYQSASAACRETFNVSRRVRRMLLLLLWPVEAATRRLIVVLASRLIASTPPAPNIVSVAVQPATPTPAEALPVAANSAVEAAFAEAQAVQMPTGPLREGASVQAYMRPFALTDPVKRFDWLFSGKPHDVGWQGPLPASPYEQVDISDLLRRIAALTRALEDLPAQAERLVRWRRRRLRARGAGKFVALSPLRPGRPHGSPTRRAPKEAKNLEHDVLAEAHSLAWETRFDTS
jgi:hypothetical protein